MANFIKCGRRYINIDRVDIIEHEHYNDTSKKVKILFAGSEVWATYLISYDDFKDFEASLAKYTN